VTSAPPRRAAAALAVAAQAAPVRTLHPGDVAVAQRGERLATLLGSCVAIVLTDPRRTVGAMCHVVSTRHAPGERRHSTAFGEAAMLHMQASLRAHGIEPRLCEAFAYGGGNMFGPLGEDIGVGMKNAHWALDALDALGVRLLAHDLGGDGCRKLAWTVGPGEPEVTTVAV
jgi:chemotaxis protein CheD